jgi:hypothetical protein
MAHGEEEQRTSPEILQAVLALSNDPQRPYQYKLKGTCGRRLSMLGSI